MPPSAPFKSILGINFFTGTLNQLLEITPSAGLIVVPSAPTLALLATDPAYRQSVEKSDFAITDSGFMVLLWKLLTGESLIRISGLKFLRALIDSPLLRAKASSLWVMPTENESVVNLAWLQKAGLPLQADDCFIAPMYPPGPIQDPHLLELIEAKKPAYILINIGGGVQERLGYYLKEHLSYRPTIICVGAAIAFLTGLQANIPAWADTWMLGWLFRCLQAPGKFIPRYWRSLWVIIILTRYRDRSVTSNKQPR